MYENDYILRLVRQMAEVIAKLILNKDIKNYDLCHEITDTALKDNFGVRKELLLSLPASSIIELVGGKYHSDAIGIIAQLFLHEGEVFEAEGNKFEADRYYQKSHELLEYIDDYEETL